LFFCFFFFAASTGATVRSTQTARRRMSFICTFTSCEKS
jgi:hypothetical protein